MYISSRGFRKNNERVFKYIQIEGLKNSKDMVLM